MAGNNYTSGTGPGTLKRDKAGRPIGYTGNQPVGGSAAGPPPAAPKPLGIPDRVRQFGRNMVENFYDPRRDRADSYYNPAVNAHERMAGNQPDYMKNLYGRVSNSPPPSRTRTLYENDDGGPDHVRNAYLRRNTTNNVGDLYTKRQQSGYGVSDVQNRYKNRISTIKPSALDGVYDNAQRFASGPTVTGDRYKTRQGQGPDVLETHFDARRAQPGIADNMGPSKADGLMFNPHETVAMGDRYHQLLDSEETPGYLEDFFLRYQDGSNPYANRARSELSKTMEKRAAATGGFNAGASMRQQGEALADLEAKEFEKLGAMAGQAQGLKQERSRDVTGAGESYERSVLANRGFNLDAAKASDEYGLGVGRLSLDERTALDRLANDTSVSVREREAALDKLANDAEKDLVVRQKYGTDTAHQKDVDDLARDTQLDTLSKDSSADTLGRETAMDDLANKADEGSREDARDKIAGAAAVTKEDQDHRDYLGDLGDKADNTEINYNKMLGDLAEGASREQMTYMKNLLDGAIDLANGRSSSAFGYDKQAGETLTETEMTAIDAELKEMGIDEAKRKAFWKTIGTVGGAIIGGVAAGAVTGGMGAGAGAVAGAGIGGSVGEGL